MKTVLKYLFKFTAFILGFALILLALSSVFVPKNNAKNEGITDAEANGILGEDKHTIDVLVLGDSEAYSSVSPLQMWNKYGFTSYICATSAQPLYKTVEFLQRSLENQSPKMVFLETGTIFRETPILGILANLFENTFSIFRYHDRWKNLKLSDFSDQVDYTWTDDCKGFRYSRKINGTSPKDYMAYTKDEEKILPVNKTQIERIKSICDKNNITLVFFSAPSTKNWNYKKHNAMEKYSKSLHTDYLDFNTLTDEVPIDWSWETRDKGDHVNYFAAVKITDYIADYIHKNKSIPDHRNDPRYSKWHDAYKKYKILISSDK